MNKIQQIVNRRQQAHRQLLSLKWKGQAHRLLSMQDRQPEGLPYISGSSLSLADSR